MNPEDLRKQDYINQAGLPPGEKLPDAEKITEAVEQKVENKEISMEEFSDWSENEGNTFKQETVKELDTANTVGLEQSEVEAVKNEMGVEQDLNAINQEAENVVAEAKNEATEEQKVEKNEVLSEDKIELQRMTDRIKELQAIKNKGFESGDGLTYQEKRELEEIKEKRDELNLRLRQEQLDIKADNAVGMLIHNSGIKTENYQPSDREKYESLEKDAPFEDKIKNIHLAMQFDEILRENDGIDGSDGTHYSADEMMERITAFLTDKADANVITRTGGLRDKVVELKAKTAELAKELGEESAFAVPDSRREDLENQAASTPGERLPDDMKNEPKKPRSIIFEKQPNGDGRAMPGNPADRRPE